MIISNYFIPWKIINICIMYTWWFSISPSSLSSSQQHLKYVHLFVIQKLISTLITWNTLPLLMIADVAFWSDSHFSCVCVQMFVTEVNSHRDHIIELDKTGTHLKYFSQKQDVVLIKNLLLSVQGRWEKLVQRSVERGRLLDDARKRAKQVLHVSMFYNKSVKHALFSAV